MKKLLSAIILISMATPILAQKPRSTKTNLPKPVTTISTTKLDKVENGNLPIKKVILYSHGVGYFERAGIVTGSQKLDLQFNSGQMNDVLKSLLVLDLNGGLISTVTYDTSKPIDRQLAEFSISLSDSNQRGLTTLIAQMRGARVEVQVGSTSVEGKVVGLEKRRLLQNQNVIETDALVLSTDAGNVRTFDLNEIRGIRIVDPKLRSDLEHYLDILNGTHKKDSRNLVISAQGEGRRKIMAGYTIEAPVWKTTYRIVIDDKGKPYLQGWAIVDNEQDEDWEDVELSLVSGLPVSFVQDLQTARYRRRPIVGFKEDLALAPQTYEEGLQPGNNQVAQSSSEEIVVVSPPDGAVRIERETQQLSQNFDNRKLLELPANGRNFENFALTSPSVSSGYVGPNTQAIGGSVQSAATGQNLGELFQYKVNHTVTIKRNSSALIPIVTSKVEGESVSIFNEASRMKNPMSGVLLHNTTGLTLESGPLTVFEGDTYAGESLIDRLKPEEKRFLTYAADLGTTISTKFDSTSDTVSSVKITGGLIQMEYKRVENKTYTILNKDDKPKTIIIEHPSRSGWELKDKKDLYEDTENYHRFRVVVPAKKTIQFPVLEESSSSNTIFISNLSTPQIEIYFNAQYFDAATKESLLKIQTVQQQIADLNREIASRNVQLNEINTDQNRIRENLKAVGKTDEEKKLIARYTQKLNEGEDAIERLRKEVKSLTESRDKLQEELSKMITSITFETTLK